MLFGLCHPHRVIETCWLSLGLSCSLNVLGPLRDRDCVILFTATSQGN